MFSTTTSPTEWEKDRLEPRDKVNATLHGRKPNSDQVQVAFSQKALLEIEEHSNSDLTRELGGALLGHALQKDDSTLVKVLASLPVITSDHGPVHFTFTADAWALLHSDKEKKYPDLDIVGWYHTHPDLGVFYSSDDVIVHSAAFVMPWHVGLVIDPIRGEAFLAGWQSNHVELVLAGISGCYEILDLQETSLVNWRLVESSVWHQDGYVHDKEELSNQVVAPNSEWPALPPISPWWGVALGGLSLLISLLLLIERFLANAS
jgi:proteasome lid subunit RPN8/RPN11